MVINILDISKQIFWILIIVSTILMSYKIVYFVLGLFPSKKLPNAKKDHSYAVLIPARNESKIIERLFKSIKTQNYNQDFIDVYVIVENINDPTVSIAKMYGYNVFVRKRLDLKGKGWALDEVVKKIFSGSEAEKYEAFFVVDADNELSPTFFTELNKAYDLGYDFGKTNIEIANANDSWLSCSTGITFSLINTFANKARFKMKGPLIISGQGFYIDAKILKKHNGFPFHSLTEDYEMCMDILLNDYTTAYIDEPLLKDRSPVDIKNSWNQRKRWVRGYSDNFGIYKSKLFEKLTNTKKPKFQLFEQMVGILPLVLFIVAYVGFNIFAFFYSLNAVLFNQPNAFLSILTALKYDAILYVLLSIITLLVLFFDRKSYHIGIKTFLKTVLLNPFYMLLYIPIAIQAIFSRDVKWVPIERQAINSNEIEEDDEDDTVKQIKN